MKKTILIITIILSVSYFANSQNNLNVGAGYFGNTLVFPGLVLELENEKMFSEKVSIPIRFDMGFYYHKRYNSGVFADINLGFRRYFKSGLFLEESIGFGIISTFVNADKVYKINEVGELEKASSYATTDLMPSITLGIGYNLSKKSDNKNLVWVRPKVFWQFPHKTTSFYSVALQIGYSHTFKIY